MWKSYKLSKRISLRWQFQGPHNVQVLGVFINGVGLVGLFLLSLLLLLLLFSWVVLGLFCLDVCDFPPVQCTGFSLQRVKPC